MLKANLKNLKSCKATSAAVDSVTQKASMDNFQAGVQFGKHLQSLTKLALWGLERRTGCQTVASVNMQIAGCVCSYYICYFELF